MKEPIDITPGGPIPPADPAAARRRRLIGLLAAGAVASVVAGGVGYAALDEPAQRRATVLPAVSVPVVPFGGGLVPPSVAVPSAAPVLKSAPAPRATPSPSRTPPSAKPARPAEPAATPEPPTSPPRQAQPEETTAWYSGGGRWRPDGLHRYGGSISLTEEEGWRVRLTVPGGNRVHAGGNVTVRQNGERVVFTPGPDGAAGFDFWIDGVLPAEPHGCLVNGHACG